MPRLKLLCPIETNDLPMFCELKWGDVFSCWGKVLMKVPVHSEESDVEQMGGTDHIESESVDLANGTRVEIPDGCQVHPLEVTMIDRGGEGLVDAVASAFNYVWTEPGLDMDVAQKALTKAIKTYLEGGQEPPTRERC